MSRVRVLPTAFSCKKAGNEISFEHKKVDVWTVEDVIGWLTSLRLSEYSPAFRTQRIDGRSLRQCDRSRFTQLGVTRIAHRQVIESALRGLLQ
uniref:SAM domain-containing protein n=1 Tax=Caenorhabditis japonica TaxID=281687 RepID=A0A8R1ISJ0_CAEJA